MKRYSLFLLCSLSALSALAAPYQGRVFVDANGNGTFDKGEKTLKGVMVSDGRHVVKTQGNGTYELPGHERERFLFVTVPSGYKTTCHYHAIEKGRDNYDFALRPYNAHIGRGGAHHFVQISDTEISTATGQEEWVADVRSYAHNEEAAFIIHTGDICYEKGLKAHQPMFNTGNMDIPIYYCIGNHDLVKGKYGEELFESIYGPVYYSFDVGNVHYIVTPMWGGDYRPGYTKEDVYHWLVNDLAQIPQGKPIVIFNHDYWTTEDRHVFKAGEGMTIDLDAHNLKAWIYGHVHINHITRHGKALAICTSTLARGGIDHAASAFRSIRVDANGNLTSDLRYTYMDKVVEIASIQNEQAPVTEKGEVVLSVNAYHTVSKTSAVTCTFRAEGKMIRPEVKLKQQTDFNWFATAKLPAGYEGKTVTVEAKVTFADGETAVRESFFTYSSHPLFGKTNREWSNLGGNAQHTCISPDTLSQPFSLAWTTNLGSNVYMTSPVVEGNSVFAASIDENAGGKAAIVAMDTRNGNVRWKYPVRASVKNSIAIAQGLLFAQDIYGYLYALDIHTGKLAWEKKLEVARVPGLDDGLVASADKVFAGSGKGLCALDARTGKQLWQNKEWSQREGTTATLSLSPDESVLVGGVQWSAMYANDARTGKLLWDKSENGIRSRASSPAMYDGAMYFLSLNSLFILSERTGRVLARKELPYSVDVTSTPLVTEGEIIFGTATEGLVALDRETLEEKWKLRTGKALIYTAPYVNEEAAQIECSPVLTGDVVIVGASDGVFYAVDRRNGTLLWRHRTGAPILTTVAVSGQMFFGVDYAGNVYAFKAANE